MVFQCEFLQLKLVISGYGSLAELIHVMDKMKDSLRMVKVVKILPVVLQ